jgi:hypothetical protein
LGNLGFIYQILLFSLSSIGGSIFWLIKGCRTKVSEEYLKKHLLRNIFTSTIIFLIGFWFFKSRKPQVKNRIPEPTVYKFTAKNGLIILENGDTLLDSNK